MENKNVNNKNTKHIHKRVISSLYYYDYYADECSCGDIYRSREALDRHIEKSNKNKKRKIK